MYVCIWEISAIIGDRAPAYSVTTWIQIAVGREVRQEEYLPWKREELLEGEGAI